MYNVESSLWNCFEIYCDLWKTLYSTYSGINEQFVKTALNIEELLYSRCHVRKMSSSLMMGIHVKNQNSL
jgi:hypothetical protein